MFVVSDVAKLTFRRRLSRWLIELAANLLLLIGFVGLLLAGFVVAFAAVMLIWGQASAVPGIALEWIWIWAPGLIIAIIGFVSGFTIKCRSRRCILFLRRFGFDGASRALTFAVGNALGRRWRVVTLDDAELADVGINLRTRRFVIVGKWLATLCIVALLTVGIIWLSNNPVDSLLPSDSSAVEYAGFKNDPLFFGYFADHFIKAFLYVLVIIIAFSAAFIMAIVTSIVSMGALALHRASRAVKRAEQTQVNVIETISDFDQKTVTIAKRLRKVLAPRLVIVRVVDRLWQQTVLRFASTMSVVLVDVSIATPNLLWEVESIVAAEGQRTLLVGRLDHIASLMHSGREFAGNENLNARLRLLLKGREVLVYDNHDRASMKRFTQNLARSLDIVAAESTYRSLRMRAPSPEASAQAAAQ